VADRPLDRVALHLLDDGGVALAVHLELEHGVRTGCTAQRDPQAAPLDRDAQRRHAVSVEDGRDVPLGAEPASSGRTGPPTGVGDQNCL
jgi:hypothetical protein